MAHAYSSSSSAPAPAKVTTGRLLSLDVFRGVTILAMILVNNPGEWGKAHQYWPLDHADWHGWTPTDLIFPFFLFIVGTSLAYSLRKYRDGAQIAPAVYWRIVRRTALLIFLGWLPGLLFRLIGYLGGDVSALDLSTFRLPGVLVRIGLVYFFMSMIALHVPLRGQIAVGIVLLLGYWGLLAWLPNPDDYAANLSRDGNLVGLVDRAVLGQNHMYRAGGKTDPEGLLSTLPAIVTSLLGYWTGLYIQRRGVSDRTVVVLIAGGITCATIGQSWHEFFPINKKIWTSSYVLLTGGLAMVGLAGCLLKFDIWGWRRLARPFEIVGINAIFVFVGSGLLATALNRTEVQPPAIERQILQAAWTRGVSRDQVFSSASVAQSQADISSAVERLVKRHWLAPQDVNGVPFLVPKVNERDATISLHRWLYERLCTSWISGPKLASLCYALLTVAFWWFVCWVMSRFGWSIRV